MTKPFDINKPCKMRGDSKSEAVRVIAVNLPGNLPIAYYDSNSDTVRRVTGGGRTMGENTNHPYDLVNIRPRILQTWWVNVYGHELVGHKSKQLANDGAGMTSSRIACIPITIDCEEGEGL